MKLSKKSIDVEIVVKTGFHIGVGNEKMQIGGVDSAVIKDPISQLPYIPGSSIKGKIRCLLETEGNFDLGVLNDELNRFFGPTPDYISFKSSEIKKQAKAGTEVNENFESPTRLIFRDFFLEDDWKIKYEEGIVSTEVKTEIAIDRKKGSAKQGALRTIERVPPETVFTGVILIRYKSSEELKEIENTLKKGFELLNNDYLGGSGSRGYGAVEIKGKF